MLNLIYNLVFVSSAALSENSGEEEKREEEGFPSSKQLFHPVSMSLRRGREDGHSSHTTGQAVWGGGGASYYSLCTFFLYSSIWMKTLCP